MSINKHFLSFLLKTAFFCETFKSVVNQEDFSGLCYKKQPTEFHKSLITLWVDEMDDETIDTYRRSNRVDTIGIEVKKEILRRSNKT
jgi:hypothetical protein